LFLLVVFSVFAERRATILARNRAGGGGGNGDSNSGGTNETYEGTGTVVAGWRYGDNTAGAVTNADYTTSPAPLNGSQSLLLRGTSGNGAYTILNTPAGTTQMHLRWMMIITNTVVSNSRLIWCADNAAVSQMQVQIQSSGLRVVCGTANATTVATLSAGTLYYCWADYVKGSGANATAKVAFSTSKTRPTSGNNFASLSNGTSTGDARETGPWCQDLNFSVHVGTIFDDFSMNLSQEIGDFP